MCLMLCFCSFFERSDDAADPDYLASKDDILRIRVKTMGIVEEEFELDGTRFVMYDVGGQRNERKKWIHCFEDVTAVIFVAAISEYDQVLYEDIAQNRLEEALALFDEIANSRWFDNTAMILFLNKRDLFETKIATTDIRQPKPDGTFYFDDYTGGCDYASGLKYIIRQFIARNRNEDRELYYHVTTATNTENINTVFNACKHIILKDNLAATGFLE
jgi:guanine nucleotide-binding protein G(i) subunit alpha